MVFVLHKNECAGLEASLGGAAGLDSGESIVRILRQMADNGYQIKDIPESGETLMQTFLQRKAIAEFRWTTVDEIVDKGGHLALLDNEIYEKWFDALPKRHAGNWSRDGVSRRKNHERRAAQHGAGRQAGHYRA